MSTTGAVEKQIGTMGLSSKFWQLAHALIGGWEMMNQLLDKEWQVLRDRRFASIWNIGRHKEKLAAQLKAIEERIDSEIPGFQNGVDDSEHRWNALLSAASGPDETAKLVEWKSALTSSKKRAFMVNRRLWYWINEQQELNRQLATILSGRNSGDEVVIYGSDASLSSRKEKTFNVEAGARHVAEDEARGFFHGFSGQRAARAMSAYRKVSARHGELE